MMMSRVRAALRLPPDVLLRRIELMAARSLSELRGKHRDRRAASHGMSDPGALCHRIAPAAPPELEPHRPWIAFFAGRYRQGEFDLLGSGWVGVHHGMNPAGVEGHRYDAGPAVNADADGAWLTGRINPANIAESRRLWGLADADHQPIDWQLDFKSGFRWSEKTWYRDVAYGHRDGVDIKVPWELGRLQHLVVLAWAHMLDGAHDDSYRRAFRNHVLDFLATNPPRFGVQWVCTMDVAIRAANLALAWDLFRYSGAEFDDAFTIALRSALLAHGHHIVANLEWYPEGRGNHYLADIAGLAFVGAYLPRSPEADVWLAFASRALTAELDYQFLPDGANFEASVCYHRLSGEIAALAAALLAGLDGPRRAAIEAVDGAHWPIARVPFPAAPPVHLRAREMGGKLDAMARFTLDATKPSGRVAQIGDNDSGRFVRAQPVSDGGTREDSLDHRSFVGLIGGVLGRAALTDAAGPFVLDGWLGSALATIPCPRDAGSRRDTIGSAVDTDLEPAGATVILAPGAGGLRDGLSLSVYPEFGFYLFRSQRLWLGVRCGPIGQNGRGGHAHNDQLSIELCIDGIDWLCDPGSYLYTPLPKIRNAYRSVGAHAAPRSGRREPGSLQLGAFWLGNEAQARCLYFGMDGFCGEHSGFGFPIRRCITLADDRIVVTDSGDPTLAAKTIKCASPSEAREAFGLQLPFSPNYGDVRTS